MTGVISMFSSDSPGDGRVGEKLAARCADSPCHESRPRQTARRYSDGNDNFLVLRYVAKLTINPAIAHGVSHIIGLSEGQDGRSGSMGPAFFRCEAEDGDQGGMINWALMGDPTHRCRPAARYSIARCLAPWGKPCKTPARLRVSAALMMVSKRKPALSVRLSLSTIAAQ